MNYKQHGFDADNVLDACRKCGEWVNHVYHAITHSIEMETKAVINKPASATVYSCGECGGSNIYQQANIMVDPNNVPSIVDLYKAEWEDYFYCNDCQQDVSVEESN